MIRAKKCEKLSKFVEVTAKILSVLIFRTRCIMSVGVHKIKYVRKVYRHVIKNVTTLE